MLPNLRQKKKQKGGEILRNDGLPPPHWRKVLLLLLTKPGRLLGCKVEKLVRGAIFYAPQCGNDDRREGDRHAEIKQEEIFCRTGQYLWQDAAERAHFLLLLLLIVTVEPCCHLVVSSHLFLVPPVGGAIYCVGRFAAKGKREEEKANAGQ